VTTEQGTGCVHTAPGHGADDFRTGQRYGLPVIAPVDERGCYTAEVPDYEGQHVFRANAAIEERLHTSGRLLNPPGAIYRVDRYPHCWRTKKPLIFRATAQWFLRVDHADLRERALDAIGRTRWIPTWGENRIRGMIEQRPDWCLSRQRAWGVPIPSYRCGTCGEHTLDADLIARVADAMQTGGSNVWLEQPVEAFLPEGAVCPHCGGPSSRFEKGQDTLDVWFDSGVSWAAVVRDRLGGEGMIDLYLEGSDQHRGWFHTSLLTSVAAQGDAPYRAVLTHGFIVDEKGHKYAKSSPNFEPLSRMLDQHGSEVFRLWVAMTDYRTDVTLSNDSLKQAAGAYRKIRNTLRFLLGNLGDFDPTTVDPSTLPFDALDAWMLRRIDAFVERARRAYDDCEFHILFHELLELCNEHLSAVYLDVLKDRMYCEAPDDPRRVASQVVMYRALTTIVRAAAPVLSFTCDEIWPLLPADPARPASVFLADFPQVDAVDAWDEGFDLVELLLTVRRRVSEEIERLRPRRKGEREPGQIGSSQEAVVRVRVTPDRAEELQANVELLREICIVASLTVEASPRPHESGVHVTMGFDEVAERLQAVSLRHESGMDVEVTRSEEPRCPRCWNHRSSIGLSARFPELCGRCVSVVERFHVPPAPGGATA
jgi:isoleucyl-tRNA synthetase